MYAKRNAARVVAMRQRTFARVRILSEHHQPYIVGMHAVKYVEYAVWLWKNVYIRLNNCIQDTINQRTVCKEKVFPATRQQDAVQDV